MRYGRNGTVYVRVCGGERIERERRGICGSREGSETEILKKVS